MSDTHQTSMGHTRSDPTWLDAHFESARAEYENSLRDVGVQPGWTVLDAGCGSGNFLPLMCELVGSNGRVVALDLAPENIDHVDRLTAGSNYAAKLEIKVGNILSLPFANATFDCVWSANVVQALTEVEFKQAVAEFQRVLKPGGKLAIKDHDLTLFQVPPMDPSINHRLTAARRAKDNELGILGVVCGTSLPRRLRLAGLVNIQRRGWFVERWAPVAPATRLFVENVLTFCSGLAIQYDVPAADLERWREVAAHPEIIIDDPDFCLREFFVVATGYVPA